RTAVVDRCNAELGAFGQTELLPRHDVGVVLKIGNDDFVTRTNVLLSEGRGDEVDRLGCSARKDDFFRRAGAEEACHLAARVFVSVGSARRKLVRRAVNVRVFVLVEITETIDDGLWLLGRRGVIEPNERPA